MWIKQSCHKGLAPRCQLNGNHNSSKSCTKTSSFKHICQARTGEKQMGGKPPVSHTPIHMALGQSGLGGTLHQLLCVSPESQAEQKHQRETITTQRGNASELKQNTLHYERHTTSRSVPFLSTKTTCTCQNTHAHGYECIFPLSWLTWLHQGTHIHNI